MKQGMKRLYSGDFNTMIQEEQPDGSVKITLAKRGDPKVYQMLVKGLYTEEEQVLSHEVINRDTLPWVRARMAQAAKGKDKRG